MTTNSTPWTLKDAMNSSKSGARSIHLPSEKLDGREALLGRPRQPVAQRRSRPLLFVERCDVDDPVRLL
jgi:hypothetical protein